jgi:hypothetical protein
VLSEIDIGGGRGHLSPVTSDVYKITDRRALQKWPYKNGLTKKYIKIYESPLSFSSKFELDPNINC